MRIRQPISAVENIYGEIVVLCQDGSAWINHENAMGLFYAIEKFGEESETPQEIDPLDPWGKGEYRDGEAALGLLGLGIIGGTFGAVGYPIYDVVKTTKKINFRKKYPLAGSDGFRVEIREK